MASRWQLRVCGFGAGVLAAFLGLKPALSAERIFFAIGPLLQSVSVDSLTAFAKEGRLTGDLERYAPFIGDQQLQEFKGVLNQSYAIDPLTIGNLAYTPLGSAFLERLGNIFQTESGNNGMLSIRSALISTAQSPEGFTVLGFLQNFPTDMRINTHEAVYFMQALTAFREYRASSLSAIAAQSQQEAATAAVNFSQLPDLTQTGAVPYNRQTLTITAPSSTSAATPANSFPAALYLPQQASSNLPVVVLVPSPGDLPATSEALATTLASHGIAAVVPQLSEDAPIAGRTSLENHLNAKLTPAEFLNRPQAISTTLDALETWDQAEAGVDLNLEKVGVIGTYIGGYSALAVAGAGLDRLRLEGVCTGDGYVINLSLLLQCQALQLPADAAPQPDPRIGAVVAINPLSSALLGPEAISQINVPVMIIGSSDDLLTPAISEQVHPFIWLNSPDKILALKVPPEQLAEGQSADSPLLLPTNSAEANTALSEQYNQALSLAFMERYIADQSDYAPYLQAAYGQYLSQEPLTLLLLQNLTLEQLQTAYGDAPPAAALPELSMR